MKFSSIIPSFALSAALIASAIGLASTSAQAAVIDEHSHALRIDITGGMTDESIVETFTQDDMRGLVFGQIADVRQVDLKDTFCVSDLPIKTITVTDEFGNEVLYRSSEQNCWDEDEEQARFGGFAPRFLDYREMNRFLSALGLPVVAID